MITVRIKTASHYPVNRKRLIQEIEAYLSPKITSNAEISVIVGGDRQMKILNTKYRQIPHTTDVLSFPQHDPSQAMHPFVTPPDNVLYLGDIVLSYPQVVKEASEDQMMVDDKLVQLVLHGLDHLMGIHHD
jgi:probable rRNA maturation factor